MARIIPDGWRELASSGTAAGAVTAAAQRHAETLALLSTGLPDDYTVYHAVHWTTVERGFSVFGEIDFVVVNRLGDLLLVEQKTGFLEEGTDGLLKRERGRIRNVPVQMARTVATLREKLARRPGCEAVKVDYLLYCPDYAVRRVESAGLSADRLVDAQHRDKLIPTIRRILPPGRPTPSGANGPAWQQVDRFFRDVIELETDVNALVGQAQAMVTRISGGLAHWARELEFSPFRLHVAGTAGSGKTQLALAEHRDALARGRRPLYVCYNRPLADHFAAIVPEGGEVCTFHTLCQRLLRDAGRSVDLTAPDGFERLVHEAAQVPIDARWRFDTVVVDEGQDFPAAWRDQVLRHAKDDARVIWLEDPMQALYAREPAALPGWVTLHARANYRSPREVVRLLSAILPPDVEIEAAGPLAEAGLELIEYADAEGLMTGTKEAIRKCLSAGFRRADIAVVSFRGREGSALLGLDSLGPHPIRRFTGRYDLLAQPVYTEGELLIESVYRFKGQAAPAVVLSEVDFESLDERAVKKLFVGATRATMKLVIVASERAAKVLRAAARA
ncbi:MAG TPA: ATP-dependent helicase [Burkholderiaceae bacterium]|nr:ATP-dependent helicase [Burkholderiaceae bacterium]